MTDLIKLERAEQDGVFIGFRITTEEESCLVFADQEKMPGIRSGDGFVPSFGSEIIYSECEIRINHND